MLTKLRQRKALRRLITKLLILLKLIEPSLTCSVKRWVMKIPKPKPELPQSAFHLYGIRDIRKDYNTAKYEQLYISHVK